MIFTDLNFSNLFCQIGSELVDPIDEALPDEKRKEIFYFFLKDFLCHMKNVSANIKSVSQAIRSYGYFAAVRAKILYRIFAYS